MARKNINEGPTPALANLWHACPKWHARGFCVVRAIILSSNKFLSILVVWNHLNLNLALQH